MRIISETEVVAALGTQDCVDCLEWKDGELCLRLADQVEATADGRFRITKQWARPMGEPWSRDFYRMCGE